ncbi:MAG: membrane protein insertion efficiency factor YidD [Phycisphaerales bacterium JB063]
MIVTRWANAIVSALLVAGVWLYRVTLGWVMGGHCRYQPTCSQYMLDAIAKHGPWRGGWRGIKRIARCHPWGGSGHDPA